MGRRGSGGPGPRRGRRRRLDARSTPGGGREGGPPVTPPGCPGDRSVIGIGDRNALSGCVDPVPSPARRGAEVPGEREGSMLQPERPCQAKTGQARGQGRRTGQGAGVGDTRWTREDDTVRAGRAGRLCCDDPLQRHRQRVPRRRAVRVWWSPAEVKDDGGHQVHQCGPSVAWRRYSKRILSCQFIIWGSMPGRERDSLWSNAKGGMMKSRRDHVPRNATW